MLIDGVDAFRGAPVEDHYCYCSLIGRTLITLLSLVYGCVCFWLEMKTGGDCSFEFVWIEDMVEYRMCVRFWLG